jgi:hypothetical protein
MSKVSRDPMLLADAFGVGYEVMQGYLNEGKSPREATFYADQAVALMLDVPVHRVPALMRPAKVRRETRVEAGIRQILDQLPPVDVMRRLLEAEALGMPMKGTINALHEPGKPTFVERITATANSFAKGWDSCSPNEYDAYLRWGVTPGDLKDDADQLAWELGHQS